MSLRKESSASAPDVFEQETNVRRKSKSKQTPQQSTQPTSYLRESLDMEGRGWFIDLTAAFTCVYFNEPLIPIITAALRGGLMMYGRYLMNLDLVSRLQHEIRRNTAAGLGFVVALPLLVQQQTQQGLLCGIAGAAIGLLLMSMIGKGRID